MDKSLTGFDLCEGGLPQKPFMKKRSRVSFSSGVDYGEGRVSSQSGRRIDSGRSSGLFCPFTVDECCNIGGGAGFSSSAPVWWFGCG